jgi:hypothetical protein
MEKAIDLNNASSFSLVKNSSAADKIVRELQVSVHNLIGEVERLNENCDRLVRYQNNLESVCHVWDGWIKRATKE